MNQPHEWTESGRELLREIEDMFNKNGGYKLYRLEAILENTMNPFSPSAKLIKNEIRRLREKNFTKGR